MELEVASVDFKTYVDLDSGATKECVNVLHQGWAAAATPPAHGHGHPNVISGQGESLYEVFAFQQARTISLFLLIRLMKPYQVKPQALWWSVEQC